ncbi:E3 ubiquitin-protein ligase TRIM45-like [Sycon ciliatum]|uniref:E3 ubiquitin-protein ligase TRIM45-like n=1 Tax=Sycon ciliatum TaxID=27933 RepID=UPI0020A8C66D|eukprot:scpid40609/ scgid15788/ Tripartite motif-containing protein 45
MEASGTDVAAAVAGGGGASAAEAASAESNTTSTPSSCAIDAASADSGGLGTMAVRVPPGTGWRHAGTACPECNKALRIPRLLDCLHTVCEDCLRPLLQPVRWMIVCPICRQETKLPPAGFSVIPMNWVASAQQREQFAQISIGDVAGPSDVAPLCEECIQEEESPAAGVCIECRVFLCSVHMRAHMRSRTTKSHSIIDQKEKLSPGEVRGEFCGAAVMCGVHPHRPILGFCRDCKRTYCVNCRNLSHVDHDLVEMHDVGPIFKTALSDRHSSVKDRLLPNFQLAVKDIDNALDKLEDRSQEISIKITEWVNEQVQALRAMERQALTAVSDLRAQKEAPLVQTRQELNNVVQKIFHCTQLTEETLALENNAEMLDMYVAIDNRMQKLQSEEEKTAMLDLDKFDFLQYSPNADLQLQLQRGIGTVTNQPACPQLSYITREMCPQADGDQHIHLTVQLLGQDGEPYEPGIDEKCLTVSAHSPLSKPVDIKVESCQRGKFIVTFLPTAFGEYVVDVRLNSLTIKNSPYAVCVPLRLLSIDGQRCMEMSDDRRTAECARLGDCAVTGNAVLREGRHTWRVEVQLPMSSALVIAVGVIAMSADGAGCKLYQAHTWRSDGKCTKSDGSLVHTSLGRWMSGDVFILEMDCDRHVLTCTLERNGVRDSLYGILSVVRPFFFMQDVNHAVHVLSP